MIKTTEKHFQIFKKECRKWIDFFGLKEWNVFFHHAEYNEEAWATTVAGYEQKAAEIYLNPEWNEERPLDEYHLKLFAFHEMCHLLLWDFSVCGRRRYISKDELENKEHEIIMKLSNSVFKNENSINK